jgi:hypothetical protein
MRKLSFIQEFIGSILLPYKAKKVERKLQLCNFETAKTIGIVYDALDQEHHKKIAGFIDLLLKTYAVQVHAVGFVLNAELRTAFSGQNGCKYITQKDFTWYGDEQNSIISDFISTPYDMLLDLSIETTYPMLYLTRLSKASFKVGRYIENDMRYDLMIDVKKHETIDYLIEQIHVYLSMIKVKK